jgi:hypothetical protein
MLSRETLRYKQIQSDIAYRREVGALGGARRSEARASEAVRTQEQLFWKEVSRVASAPPTNAPQSTGIAATPLDRMLAAHTKLLEAKRAHAAAQEELQAGVARVSQSDAVCTKVRGLTQALKQRWAALLEGKREDEITEMLTQMPALRRNEAAVWPQRSTEVEISGVAARNVALGASIGERYAPDSTAIVRAVIPTVPDRALGAGMNPPVPVSAIGVVRDAPAVQSVELRPLAEGPCLRVQSVLSSGTPVTISLTRGGSGAVSAVVESPHMGVTAQLTRERANVLAKLGSLGISLSGLEIRRGGDVSVGADRPLRRPRWIEEGEDESGIA